MLSSMAWRCSMPAIAAEAREALAEITTAACDDAESTDAVLACFGAADEIVTSALSHPVVI
jgi:hypothetical protein